MFFWIVLVGIDAQPPENVVRLVQFQHLDVIDMVCSEAIANI
jgi:hypothetical protein